MDKQEIIFYQWTDSATGNWDKDSGLRKLSQYANGDISLDKFVELMWPEGGYVQNSAILELLAHGNIRQAASFVRSLMAKYPVCETTLRTSFRSFVDLSLSDELNSLPSNPSEYPPDIVVRYYGLDFNKN